jgi:hypothetical protein
VRNVRRDCVQAISAWWLSANRRAFGMHPTARFLRQVA